MTTPLLVTLRRPLGRCRSALSIRQGLAATVGALLVATLGPPSARAAGTERDDSPVQAYKRGTFSLLAGTGYATTVGSGGLISGAGGGSQGFVSMGVDARRTFAPGLVLNGRLGLLHANARGGTNIGSGLGVGAVIPLSDWAAFLPMFDVNIAIDTTARQGFGISPLGTLAIDLFPGRHGFVELYGSGGALLASTGGSALAVMILGYRLGVMF
jgi:hypothetical protein